MKPPKKTNVSIVRCSAAKYRSFFAAKGSGDVRVEMRHAEESLWLTQNNQRAARRRLPPT